MCSVATYLVNCRHHPLRRTDKILCRFSVPRLRYHGARSSLRNTPLDNTPPRRARSKARVAPRRPRARAPPPHHDSPPAALEPRVCCRLARHAAHVTERTGRRGRTWATAAAAEQVRSPLVYVPVVCARYRLRVGCITSPRPCCAAAGRSWRRQKYPSSGRSSLASAPARRRPG